MTLLAPFANGDLYLSVMKGGAGLGDPLLRAVEHGRSATSRRGTCCRASPSPSTASPTARPSAAGAWSGRCRCASGSRAERERILAQDFAEPVKAMYAESMRLSPRWAAEYRGFWDLPEDFDYDVATPTVDAPRARSPGKLDPDEAADAFLAGLRPARRGGDAVPRARGRHAGPRDARGAARRAAHAARGQGHPVRLQGRRPLREVDRGAAGSASPYEDPIVLPAGEGLNIVRRRARRRARLPLRLRARLLRAQPQLEDGRGRLRARERGGDARDLPEDGRPRSASCSRSASTTARPAPASSRSRRSSPDTRSSTSSCPTSRASTAAGSGASCPRSRARRVSPARRTPAARTRSGRSRAQWSCRTATLSPNTARVVEARERVRPRRPDTGACRSSFARARVRRSAPRRRRPASTGGEPSSEPARLATWCWGQSRERGCRRR